MDKKVLHSRVTQVKYQLGLIELQRAIIQYVSEGKYANESEGGGTWEGDVMYDDDGRLAYRLIHTVEKPEPGVHDVDEFYMEDAADDPPTP